MGEGRATSRPRLCLSCATCRRRKVRCTKEQPACNSCVRTNEECKYDKAAWKKADAQAKQKKAAGNNQNKDRANKKPDVNPQEDNWIDWIGQPFEPIQAQPGTNGAFTNQSAMSKQQSHNTMPPSAPQRGDTNNDDINLSDISAVGVGDSFFSPDQSGLFDDFSNVIHWSSANHESLPASSTPLIGAATLVKSASTVSNYQSTASPKRAETPTDRQPKPRPSKNKPSQDAQSPIKTQDASVRMGRRQGSAETGRPNQPPPGHFSGRDEARSRYVGAAFWGYVKNCRASRDMPHPHIDYTTLTNLLSLLPSRPVCNTLLYSFLIGVRPVYPLIHVPSFRADYDDFWQCHSTLNNALQNPKFANDPTFLCLLFSVLYCGAATTPSSFWATGALQSVAKEVILEQLRNASSSSLKAVQHLRHPTSHSLVALLLRHSCLKQGGDTSHDSNFVSTAVRIGQSMGLHLEPSKLGFDVVDCEMRRRVWWHILWLDLQNSIFTGLPLYFHHNAAQNNAQMVGEAQDKDICEPIPKGMVTPSTAASSASMLFAIGRFETARFERMLVDHLHSTEGFDSEEFTKIENTYAKLQLNIDTLIARIPAKGIPEKGLIPSRLANASPLSQRELYSDHVHEATVFTSWTRIMLTMLKTEAAILFQRVFMEGGKAKNEQDQGRWNSIDQLCIAYLRNFLQMMQIPAFAPYAWFNSTYFGPLQAVFLILVYMQNNHDPESEPQALYLVDEVIDFFVSEEDSVAPLTFVKQPSGLPKPTSSSSTTQLNLAWTVLKSLRSSLPSHSPSDQAQAAQQQAPSPFPEIYLNPLSITSLPEHIPSTTARNNFINPAQPHTPQTPLNTPTFSANLKAEPNHFQTAVSNALSPLFTPPQDPYDTFGVVDDDMDMMVDFSDTDAWSDSLVQAAEEDLSLIRMEKTAGPEVSFATPVSLVKTPASISEKNSAPWPGKVSWSQDGGARREGISSPREEGVCRGGSGGGHSTPQFNGNSGNALADMIVSDDFWMDL